MAELSDKAREEFFSEAQEIIETLSRNLLSLDASVKGGAADPSLINEAFRAVHTLKGLAGLFGAQRLGALSHRLEDLLDDLRLGRMNLSDDRFMRPSRKSSSRSSRRWESAPSRCAPNSPAKPFRVCTARNASLINEGSAAPPLTDASRLSKLRDSVSMISCASEKNSSRALSLSSAMRL